MSPTVVENSDRSGNPRDLGDPAVGITCDPRRIEPLHDHVLRNDGDRFVNVTGRLGDQRPRRPGLGVVMDDLNEDGRIDLFVAIDSMANFLFRNLGSFRFGGGSDQLNEDSRLPFGLGSSPRVELAEVRCPSGAIHRHRDSANNPGYLLREGNTTAQRMNSRYRSDACPRDSRAFAGIENRVRDVQKRSGCLELAMIIRLVLSAITAQYPREVWPC